MSVIINDFEIVTDSPGDEGAENGASMSASEPAAPSTRPIDVTKIVDRETRRRRRLRAH